MEFHQPLLPSLANNIKCGNSLIDSAYYDSNGPTLFNPGKVSEINAFEWKSEFPEITKRGGFDVIIGNPPYRREKDFKHLLDEVAATPWGKKYRVPRMDLWYYFVHRALELIKTDGVLSYIVNSYWTAGTGAEKLIQHMGLNCPEEFFSLSKLKVFHRVSGQHMVFRIQLSSEDAPVTIKNVIVATESSAEPFVVGTAEVDVFTKSKDRVFVNGQVNLQREDSRLQARFEHSRPLHSFGRVRQGIAENPACINHKTNEKFRNRWRVGEGVFALRKPEMISLRLPKSERNLLRSYHDLCDLSRYWMAPFPSLTLIYSTKRTCPDIDKYPTVREHLSRFKTIMDQRRETKKGSNRWWHLHWPRDEEIWKLPKVISVQMERRPTFVPCPSEAYVPFSVNVFIPNDLTPNHLYYFAALLNSRLLWYWYIHNAKRRGVGLEINGNVLRRSPIRQIDFSAAGDKIGHDKLVTLVDKMLALHKQLPDASTDHAHTLLQRQIDATDRQIDRLVYELYELTDDEINIVEGSTNA